MSYAKRVDGNQPFLVHRAESIGAVWINLSRVGEGVFDGILCFRGQKFFVEFKNHETSYGRKGFNKNQQELANNLARVGVQVHAVTTEEELYQLLGVH